MKCREQPHTGTGWGTVTESGTARARLLSLPFEPLFVADWQRVLMVHYEVEPEELQMVTPLDLDLWEGRALISLVCFRMHRLRPRFGGWLTQLPFRPIGTHDFLNVRAYVKHEDEAGIYFLAEWVSNPVCVPLGPIVFGLPYRFGRMAYDHSWEENQLRGSVNNRSRDKGFSYDATLQRRPDFRPCAAGSLDGWLMERYTAFTQRSNKTRFFRVWHEPWLQTPANVRINDMDLLAAQWPFFERANLVGANFSPGVANVWMGRPHRLIAPDTGHGR